MRGFTRKRGKTWTAYWEGPVKLDPTTGHERRRQRSRGGFRTQKEAQAHLNTVLVDTNEGTYFEPSKQTLANFMLSEWLPGINATVRPLTRYRYERVVRTYIESRDIGSVSLSRLTGGHVSALRQGGHRPETPAEPRPLVERA